VHFATSVSPFVKNSQTTETAGCDNGLGMRVIKSGEKAMDGRKGPSMAFSPLYSVGCPHG